MVNYQDDRNFSDFVFHNLAVPTIYPEMDWTTHQIDANKLNNLDIHNGIDAVALNNQHQQITIQYRFRDYYYRQFNDATLRYQRPHNKHIDRHLSEFFKIKADFLVYGITNGKKFLDARNTNTQLVKWVVIDLDKLKQAIDNKKICIGQINNIRCQWKNNQMLCPINDNYDNSSNFVPFDVIIMQKYLHQEFIVVRCHGYDI